MATVRDVIASLVLRLSVDATGMNKEVQKIQSNLNIFKNGLKTIGKYIAGAFTITAVASFAKNIYAAAQQQYKAEQLLLTALKGREDIQKRLIEQADYLQRYTLFEDDEIINQQKFLASLGASEGIIRKVTSVATDLATAFDTDLDSAVKMLIKSYGGTTRELGKLIPEIKNLSKEELASGSAVDIVAKKMEGLAIAAALTSPSEQMIKQWGEFSEQLGTFVAPAVNTVLSGMNRLLGVMNSGQATRMEKILMLFASLGKGFSPQLAATSYMIAGMNELAVMGQEAKNGNEANEDVTNEFLEQVRLLQEKTEEMKRQKELAEEELRIAKELAQQLEAQGYRQAMWRLDTGAGKNKLLSGKSDTAFGSVMQSSIYDPDAMDNWMADRVAAVQSSNQQMLQWTEEFTMAMQNMYFDMATSFGEAIGEMIATGGRANWNTLLLPVANAFSQLGKIIIAGAIAMKEIQDVIKKFSNPYAAIAAGVALVAVAAAIKSSIQSSALAGGGTTSYAGPSTSYGNDFSRYMGQLDKEIIYVEVSGTIEGEDIRLANRRAQRRHNAGY